MSQCRIDFGDGVGCNSPVNRGRFATTAFDRLRILEDYKRIAMVGLSSNPFRPMMRSVASINGRSRSVLRMITRTSPR